MIHVLHHLNSFEEQEKLITECLKKLSSKGKLIVNEITEKPKIKRIFAWIVDHLLYPGDKIYYRTHEEFIKLFLNKGFRVKFVKTGRGTPFPQVIYILEKNN